MTLVGSYTRRGSELMRLSVEKLLRIEKRYAEGGQKVSKRTVQFSRVFAITFKTHFVKVTKMARKERMDLIKHIHLIQGNNLVMFLRLDDC